MARHASACAQADPPRAVRVLRLVVLAVVWLAGLAVGVVALLSAAATYSCGRTATGLACRPVGTALGALLVVAVIAVVTTVSVLAPDPRRLGRLAGLAAVAILALTGCYLGARALLNTA